MINTHLHFDHAGGNTTLDPELEGDPRRHVRPTFPNATYVVQRNELEFARHTNERTAASYLPHNYEPVASANRWKLIDGDVEILPGISARLTPGHVPWHQSIVIRSGGDTSVFLADVMPTHHHLPLVYIMGYDVEPLRTLESKRCPAGRRRWRGSGGSSSSTTPRWRWGGWSRRGRESGWRRWCGRENDPRRMSPVVSLRG